MKRLLLVVLALLMYTENSHCQYVKSENENIKQKLSDFIAQEQPTKTSITITDSKAFEMYHYYTVQKNKKQKTGWILLGSGVTLMATSIIWGSSDDNNSLGFSDNFDAQAMLFIAGGVVCIASIPFFISSGTNKKNAILTLNTVTTNTVTTNFKNAANKSNYLTLGLTVNL